MKRLLVLLAVMLAAVAATAPTSVAQTGGEPNGQVCPIQTSDEGVTVTDNGDGTVTVVVDEGFTLTYLCLKAGSEEAGCGFTEFEPDLEGPATEEFDIPCAKELSHFGAVTEVTETTTGGPTTGGPTTGGPTTGGPTTGGPTTGGPTTGGTTTGGTTTGGGGAGGGGGGTTGGTTGGPVGTPTAETPSGQLPFTGFPALVALLVGGGLLASGIAVYRRARHDS
jgi:hypothetical protein